MYDPILIALVRKAMVSIEEWHFVGLGLNKTEYRLAMAAKYEQNMPALKFILAHSGNARLHEEIKRKHS